MRGRISSDRNAKPVPRSSHRHLKQHEVRRYSNTARGHVARCRVGAPGIQLHNSCEARSRRQLQRVRRGSSVFNGCAGAPMAPPKLKRQG